MQAIIATTIAMMMPRHTVLPRLFPLQPACCLRPNARSKRIATVADEHAQRHKDGHQWHGGSCHRKANLTHGLAKENRVDYVVGTR